MFEANRLMVFPRKLKGLTVVCVCGDIMNVRIYIKCEYRPICASSANAGE